MKVPNHSAEYEIFFVKAALTRELGLERELENGLEVVRLSSHYSHRTEFTGKVEFFVYFIHNFKPEEKTRFLSAKVNEILKPFSGMLRQLVLPGRAKQ